jgi:Raf kinase inhibitor-like YbhB/YbcL family protein
MKLTSSTFEHNHRIPDRCALCVQDEYTHVRLVGNLNPAFAWSDLPAGTRSLVLIGRDTDAPSRPDDVNQEGRSVPADLPRVVFYHWVLVDLPVDQEGIEEGGFSQGVIVGGKPGPEGPGNTRQGLNHYTQWFADDPDMRGKYFGYDGPCPPWNDSIAHHYHFTLYALDIARCPVEGEFTGQDVLNAIAGHILDKATLTGTYSVNPALSP